MVAMFAVPAGVSASVVLHGTRVVYPGTARDKTIAVENNGTVPALVQAWLDPGDANAAPEQAEVPWLLTPPLFRLDPKQTQSLRLIYTRKPLPQDKESLFWLNVLEVPPKPAATAEPRNMLHLTFRTRIKVFFRPAGLAGAASDAPAKVHWTLAGGAPTAAVVLRATNSTPYHVTFTQIQATIGGVGHDIKEGGMVGPGESRDFPIPDLKQAGAVLTSVGYTFLDDYGAAIVGQTRPGGQ